jgi:hypothetical protein
MLINNCRVPFPSLFCLRNTNRVFLCVCVCIVCVIHCLCGSVGEKKLSHQVTRQHEHTANTSPEIKTHKPRPVLFNTWKISTFLLLFLLLFSSPRLPVPARTLFNTHTYMCTHSKFQLRKETCYKDKRTFPILSPCLSLYLDLTQDQVCYSTYTHFIASEMHTNPQEAQCKIYIDRTHTHIRKHRRKNEITGC